MRGVQRSGNSDLGLRDAVRSETRCVEAHLQRFATLGLVTPAEIAYYGGMVRSLGAIALGLLVTTAARAEAPSGTPPSDEVPSEPSCRASPPGQAADADAEERAFAAELETFARRRAFTERLIDQRNAELFREAIERQVRFARLQRELAEREKTRAEREFEDAVALYLKKREFTRERSAAASRARAEAPPPAPVSSPAR